MNAATHCRRGHTLADAYEYEGRRKCRTCALEWRTRSVLPSVEEQVLAVVAAHRFGVTPREIADKRETTLRSANRILARLRAAGAVVRQVVAGRPVYRRADHAR